MTATQLSTHSNDDHSFGEANCIDGNKDSDMGPGGLSTICLTSRGDRKPWFAIDYGTSVEVHFQRVDIFNRVIDSNGFQTRNVEVRISNELPTSSSQMFSGGNLLGSFAGSDADGGLAHQQHTVISGQSNCEMIIADAYPRSREIWQICHNSDG